MFNLRPFFLFAILTCFSSGLATEAIPFDGDETSAEVNVQKGLKANLLWLWEKGSFKVALLALGVILVYLGGKNFYRIKNYLERQAARRDLLSRATDSATRQAEAVLEGGIAPQYSASFAGDTRTPVERAVPNLTFTEAEKQFPELFSQAAELGVSAQVVLEQINAARAAARLEFAEKRAPR